MVSLFYPNEGKSQSVAGKTCGIFAKGPSLDDKGQRGEMGASAKGEPRTSRRQTNGWLRDLLVLNTNF